jgi:hypothetical protein
MKHTKYENNTDIDSMDIVRWLQSQFGKDTPIGVSMNRDGTVKEIDIGKSLTKADKKIIIDKYPELEGNEIQS